MKHNLNVMVCSIDLLNYSGRWRNQSCQIFFQSVHPGVSGKGSNFAIFSANRRWPLQLLYYLTTVMNRHFMCLCIWKVSWYTLDCNFWRLSWPPFWKICNWCYLFLHINTLMTSLHMNRHSICLCIWKQSWDTFDSEFRYINRSNYLSHPRLCTV